MKRTLTALIMAAALLLTPAHVFASGGGNGGGGGNGTGGGNGGGKSEGLFVESASIEDGATLTSDEAITLVFSKNVVNSEVAENNQALFQVLDSNQAEVAIEVTMADDQVEPDKKNDVVIQFPQGLADGAYTLTAQKGITSKSGAVMEEDFVLTFQVGGDQTAQPAPEQKPEQAPEQTPEQVPEQTPETDEAAEPEGSSMTPVIVVVIVVLVAAVGFVVLRKKK